MMRLILLLTCLLPLCLFSFEPILITPYPVVGYRTVSFEDKMPDSKRELLIWYPVDNIIVGEPSNNPWDVFRVAVNVEPVNPDLKKPVIVLSHGHWGNPHELSWLIRGLVRNGFIVISTQHFDLIDGKHHANYWIRAKDVKTILDQFFNSPMAAYADLNKIGFAGFSLGGTTGIFVIGGRATKLDNMMPTAEYASVTDFAKTSEVLKNVDKEQMAKDWRDPRIKAAFLMAPAWSWVFDENSLHQIAIPTYFIAPQSDKLLVTKNNAGLFAQHIQGAFYQNIPGRISHYIFISALNPAQQKKLDPSLQALFVDDASIDRVWIQDQVSDEAVDFFNWALETRNQ